jgi:hypothetical protein
LNPPAGPLLETVLYIRARHGNLNCLFTARTISTFTKAFEHLFIGNPFIVTANKPTPPHFKENPSENGQINKEIIPKAKLSYKMVNTDGYKDYLSWIEPRSIPTNTPCLQ